jgi:hypothetical protein
MDKGLQELVWSKLPLNEMQRQDLLHDLMHEINVPMESKQDIEMAPQVIKKRKREPTIEQCETSSHMS